MSSSDAPPSPLAAAARACDPVVEQRFETYWALTQQGHSFAASLRAKPELGNPYLLEEVARSLSIDQYASCYPRDGAFVGGSTRRLERV
jgi:hypothetical protein